LAGLTHRARPLLLDLTEDARLAGPAEAWRDRVDVVTARCQDAPATALLLRPDAYVAWASTSPSPGPDETGELQDVLSRWFGRPLSLPSAVVGA
jgi:hypothetical protein